LEKRGAINEMIRYKQGDIFTSNCEAIVNPVNTHGRMGAGLAAAFRKNFPDNNKFYKTACKLGQVKIGSMFVWEKSKKSKGYNLPQYIINFPTKDDSSKPSEYDYIKKGLEDLSSYIAYKKINSIAIPALGCGLGGLDWSKVKQMIEDYLSATTTEIMVYEPH